MINTHGAIGSSAGNKDVQFSPMLNDSRHSFRGEVAISPGVGGKECNLPARLFDVQSRSQLHAPGVHLSA